MRATDDKVTGSEKAGEMASDAAQSNTPRQSARSQNMVRLHLALLHTRNQLPNDLTVYAAELKGSLWIFSYFLPVVSHCSPIPDC